MVEAFGVAYHELVSLDFRCGSSADIPSLVQNVGCWGWSRRNQNENGHRHGDDGAFRGQG